MSCKLPYCTDSDLCHYCKRQAGKQKPKYLKKSKVSPVSDKRRKQLAKYSKDVKLWKVENNLCMAMLDGCTVKTEECHHLYGKENHLLNEQEGWLPVCSPCHRKITDMGIDEAEGLGLAISKHKKT